MRNTWTAHVAVIAVFVLIPTLAEANSGDFSGAVAIGTSYAGVDAAPSNGLLVQGNVGIGLTSPGSALDLFAANTGAGQSNAGALVFRAQDGQNRPIIATYGNLDGVALVDSVATALAVRDVSGTGRSITTSGTIAIGDSGNGGGSYILGPLGIRVITPATSLSVSPVQYNTGTGSQSGSTTVTGVGTSWTSAMIGSQFVYANGVSSGTITAVGSSTSLTSSVGQTVSSQAYTINYTGLQVGSTGKVGIGTTAPAYLLHVYSPSTGAVAELQNSSGACTHTPGASSETVTCTSDINLKSEIEDTESALAWVDEMRIRDFKVRATGERKTGVVAQELMITLPDMVHKNQKDIYSVEEPNPWKLVKTIQELHSMVLVQQVEIDDLKKTIDHLKPKDQPKSDE